jgi:dipeptidase
MKIQTIKGNYKSAIANLLNKINNHRIKVRNDDMPGNYLRNYYPEDDLNPVSISFMSFNPELYVLDKKLESFIDRYDLGELFRFIEDILRSYSSLNIFSYKQDATLTRKMNNVKKQYLDQMHKSGIKGFAVSFVINWAIKFSVKYYFKALKKAHNKIKFKPKKSVSHDTASMMGIEYTIHKTLFGYTAEIESIDRSYSIIFVPYKIAGARVTSLSDDVNLNAHTIFLPKTIEKINISHEGINFLNIVGTKYNAKFVPNSKVILYKPRNLYNGKRWPRRFISFKPLFTW